MIRIPIHSADAVPEPGRATLAGIAGKIGKVHRPLGAPAVTATGIRRRPVGSPTIRVTAGDADR